MEITIRCQWCGQPLQTRDLRRRYHKAIIINGKEIFCSHEARLEQKRQCERTRRQNGYTKPKKGTGLIGPHRHENHEEEAREILKEKRWLRLEVR